MTTFVGVSAGSILTEQPARRQAFHNAPLPLRTCLDAKADLFASAELGVRASRATIVERNQTFAGAGGGGFGDVFYNRMLIEPDIADVGNLVSEQVFTVTVFNGYQTNQTLTGLNISDTQGLVLDGPASGSVWGPLQTRTYQLKLTLDGPPQIKSDISFTWSNGKTIKVSTSGSRIVMLPFQAMAPLTETLDWKTNVITSNNGTEQRIRLRNSPRQTLSGAHAVRGIDTQVAINQLYSWIGRTWAVGVWFEAQQVTGLAAGATFIPCVTNVYDYRAGSLVGVWGSTDINEALEVESVAANGLYLTTPLQNNYSTATVIPVRKGVVSGNATRKSVNLDSTVQITFNVSDNVSLATDTPTQYKGEDIYFDPLYLGNDEGPTDIIQTRLDRVDYEVGAFETYSPWTHSKVSRQIVYIHDNHSDLWKFRKWLHRRAGRLRPFWLPTFENDYILSMTGTLGSSITVLDKAHSTLGKSRTHIAILDRAGNWYAREVQDISAVPGTGKASLTLDSAVNVTVDNVVMICHIGLHRLDQDKVDLKHIGNKVCSCTVKVLEIEP